MEHVLIGLVVLFLSAKCGGFLATKCNQPAVLGELLIGTLLGNIALFGLPQMFSFLHHSEIFKILAEIGVILLLFEVGLESNLSDLMKVGVTSTLVAIVGVVAPFFLGCGVSYFFMPEKSFLVHVFVGAALCATSVGITARVLKDLGKIHLAESKIILGAAVIDDVLGLIILAIVTGVIKHVNDTGSMDISYVPFVVMSLKAIGFLLASIIIGVKFTPKMFSFGAKLKMQGSLLTLALSFCFLLSYLATLVGLAPIVGAFAAGLIIDGSGLDNLYKEDHHEQSLEHMMLPLSQFFVPLFFVHMGMQVDLMTFTNGSVLLLGLVLSFVAILGKQACGLALFGPASKGLDRILVGVGMIPRGEVGLIFASIGSALMIHNEPVVDGGLYSSIVLMVMVTTMITPPALKMVLAKKGL